MKRYDQGDVGILVMITCILSLILGALIGVTFEENSIKRGAIKQGCANTIQLHQILNG